MQPVIIHVVPQLPPQTSGVGDFAELVGRRMEEAHRDVSCCYLAAGHRAVELPADRVAVRNVTGACESAALWRAAEQLLEEAGRQRASLVVHYSGYGYERNGAPAWITGALASRPAGWVTRVVTYFHELYADGRPWRREFWYSSRQRRIAAHVARLSDTVLTNREQSARWLEEHTGRPRGSVRSLPVPSNVGEPAQVPPITARPPRAVTFGGVRAKRFALIDDARHVVRVLKRLDIRELVDIGAPCPLDRRSFERAGIDVRCSGFLGAADVSRELQQCRVGLMDYPLTHIGKSSVFSAYAAHGVVPMLRRIPEGVWGDFAIAAQALSCGAKPSWDGCECELQRVADAARTWSQIGRSERHAEAFLQSLLGSPRRAEMRC